MVWLSLYTFDEHKLELQNFTLSLAYFMIMQNYSNEIDQV